MKRKADCMRKEGREAEPIIKQAAIYESLYSSMNMVLFLLHIQRRWRHGETKEEKE